MRLTDNFTLSLYVCRLYILYLILIIVCISSVRELLSTANYYPQPDVSAGYCCTSIWRLMCCRAAYVVYAIPSQMHLRAFSLPRFPFTIFTCSGAAQQFAMHQPTVTCIVLPQMIGNFSPLTHLHLTKCDKVRILCRKCTMHRILLGTVEYATTNDPTTYSFCE
jgi:hypothetical protein